MELDWLISTPEGQDQIVAGADAARVFLVTLNRGYKFTSAEDVQVSPCATFLTFSITSLLRQHKFGLPSTQNLKIDNADGKWYFSPCPKPMEIGLEKQLFLLLPLCLPYHAEAWPRSHTR